MLAAILLVAASLLGVESSATFSELQSLSSAERRVAVEILRQKARERRHPLPETAEPLACSSHEVIDQDGSVSFLEVESKRSPLSGLARAMVSDGAEGKVRHNRRAGLSTEGEATAAAAAAAAGATGGSLRRSASGDDPLPPKAIYTGHYPGSPQASSPTLAGCICEDYECSCSHNCQCKVLGDDGAQYLDPAHAIPDSGFAEGANPASGNKSLTFLSSPLTRTARGKPIVPSSTRNPGHMFRCDCRFSVEATQGKAFDSLACGCEPESCSCKRVCSCPRVDSS